MNSNLLFHRLLAYARAILASVSVAMLATTVVAAPSSEWQMTKIDGRDYVSAASIKRFYQFTGIKRIGNTLILDNSKVEMKLQINGNECLMNGVKFVFCNEIRTEGDQVYVSWMDLAKLIDPVLRPNFIKNAGNFSTVILDPGHGGKDSGAANSINTEATYNLKVAGLIKKQLQAQGFKVIMTRENNRFLTLQERVELANKVVEDAIFISIHFNSGAPHARGIETFTLSPPGVAHYGRGFIPADNAKHTGNMHDSANIALATAVHGSILRRVEKYTLDRGIKRARFSVLSGVRHPAILLEGGFMTHPYEARLIDNPAYQNALVSGLVEAIAKYRYAVGGKPVYRPPN